MMDRKTVSAYDSEVHNYVDFINQLPADQLLLGFITRLEPNAYVLDLGCGPAFSSAIMREHGLRVDPVDASGEMVTLANTTFNSGARQAVFEDVDTNDTYHGIWANYSLLHATEEDFPKILKALHQALKPQGLFHLGMKIGRGTARDKLDRHYTYYTHDELLNYLSKAGFVVENVELGEGLGLAGPHSVNVQLKDEKFRGGICSNYQSSA